jgi:DNA-binding IclR family transcriptional regulator
MAIAWVLASIDLMLAGIRKRGYSVKFTGEKRGSCAGAVAVVSERGRTRGNLAASCRTARHASVSVGRREF